MYPGQSLVVHCGAQAFRGPVLMRVVQVPAGWLHLVVQEDYMTFPNHGPHQLLCALKYLNAASKTRI